MAANNANSPKPAVRSTSIDFIPSAVATARSIAPPSSGASGSFQNAGDQRYNERRLTHARW